MKGYRTILLNLAMLLIPICDYLVTGGTLVSTMIDDPKWATIVVVTINILNIVLRFITTTPIGKDKPE